MTTWWMRHGNGEILIESARCQAWPASGSVES